MSKREQVLGEVQEIFRRELEIPSLNLSFSSSPDSIEGWNSVTNLLLINAIEEKYQTSLPIDVIFKLNTVGDICDYIETL